jgi:virulence factor
MSSFNLAVIGFGNMGKIHYKAIVKNQNCFSPIVVEPVLDMLNGFEDVEHYTDIRSIPEKILARLDGVIISSPSAVHFEQSLLLLQKRIPLLVEKPLTNQLDKDLELINEAKRNNVLLKCGLIELYNPIVQELSETNFDEIRFVHFKRHSPLTSTDRKLENVVSDLTLHDISIIYKIFKPKKIEILGSELIYDNGVAESAQVLLKVDDSFTIFLSTSRQDQEKIRTLEITDKNSTYFCDLKNKFFEVKQSGEISSVSTKSITESNVLKKIDMLNKPQTAEIQLESFLTSINAGIEDRQHLHIAEETHKLVYKILDS